MLLRTIIYVFVVRLRVYKVLKIFAPIAMVLSVYCLKLIPSITQNYQYQEPALRNVLHDYVTPKNNTIRPKYHPIFNGVELCVLEGMLSYESVVVAARCDDSAAMDIFQQVYVNAKQFDRKATHIIKNLGFLCYRSVKDLHNFINTLNNGEMQEPINQPRTSQLLYNLGTIRSIINLQFHTPVKIKSSPIIIDIYDKNGLSIEADFYQFLKQLMNQNALKWVPCKYSKYNLLSFLYKKYGSYIGIKENKLFMNFVMCQFDKQVFIEEIDVNSALISSGIQTATIQVQNHNKNVTYKIGRILYSYMKVFSYFEDHLHSSNSLYYPLNESKYVQIKSYVIMGAVFLAAGAVYIIIKAVNLFLFFSETKQQVQLTDKLPQFPQQSMDFTDMKLSLPVFGLFLTIYCTVTQYYYFNSLKYTFWLAIPLRLVLSAVHYPHPPNHKLKEVIHLMISLVGLLMTIELMLTNFALCFINIVLTLWVMYLPSVVNLGMMSLFLVWMEGRVDLLSNSIYVIMLPWSVHSTLIYI